MILDPIAFCVVVEMFRVPLRVCRYLLRFDSQAWNLGTTDFRPAGSQYDWIWHSCHNHYHSMEAFVHYDLFNATTGLKVAEGHKASFCLEDSLCGRSYSPRYSCYSHEQGISVGCADLYGSYLDCQWVDMTGNGAGNYTLRIHLNPRHLAVETDYTNNVAKCNVTMTSLYTTSLVMSVTSCCLGCKAQYWICRWSYYYNAPFPQVEAVDD